MSFNTPPFLFLFLPIFLISYFSAHRRSRPALGILASLLFYAAGRPEHLAVILGLILFNYWLGKHLHGSRSRVFLGFGIAADIGALLLFKTISTYGTALPVVAALPHRLVDWLGLLAFPIGLSYITFQAISYLADIHRGLVRPEGSLVSFAFYILMFPKILSGPIVRYRTLAGDLSAPSIDASHVAAGIRRFILGLAKKILIADVLAKVVNAVFALPVDAVAPWAAWLALVSYALQIYYDFSGFADMAIGLAGMMGLRFIENFDYPYIAQSIGDFWRRWHISLSSWFREYVFFPLERRRLPVGGQYINIMIVFLLTGLWHGLTQPFIVWGLLHGLLLVLEASFLNTLLRRLPRPVRHVYALSALLLTWLVFRSASLSQALALLKRLMGAGGPVVALAFTETSPLPFIEPSFLLALILGLVFSMPVYPWLVRQLGRFRELHPRLEIVLLGTGDVFLLALLILSVGMMTSSRFLPGIYDSF